jgi:hypothetical protein
MVDEDWLTVSNRRRTAREDVLAKARVAYQNNIDFLAQPAPAIPLNAAAQLALVAQVAALTRQNRDIIRVLVPDLLDP